MERKCKLCGAPISGRSDKKFCDYNCKSNYNNEKNKNNKKQIKNNPAISEIEKNIMDLHNNASHKLIKLILIFTFICKIFSNFEVNKKWRNEKNKIYNNFNAFNSK